ncbi:MAG: ABC transporter permease [bacterium]|nr:ABC transporter permease [bacterium]
MPNNSLAVFAPVAPLMLAHLGFIKAAPLIWASLGGCVSERSGVINIGLEGMMLTGAFAAAWGADAAGNPWAGVAAALLAGAAMGALHAAACLWGKANHIVSGMAVNIIALGLTGFLLSRVFHALGNSPEVPSLGGWFIPGWNAAPVSPLHPVLIVTVFATVYLMYRTRYGLRLRACGESPSAARAQGVQVTRYRFAAVCASGALAGLGGAQLAIGDVSYFSVGMSGGRGFIALAAMICAGWRPGRAAWVCLAFGVIEALGERLQGAVPALPSRLMLSLPFLIALAMLALRSSSLRQPAALGRD